MLAYYRRFSGSANKLRYIAVRIRKLIRLYDRRCLSKLIVRLLILKENETHLDVGAIWFGKVVVRQSSMISCIQIC
ncbi:hypothetical protein MARHY0487 [Marinobacter nauticus ATCC 49840]|nr:hypothetical protein MARHY0487 [Marinobacter nauticus ATCC 49840]